MLESIGLRFDNTSLRERFRKHREVDFVVTTDFSDSGWSAVILIKYEDSACFFCEYAFREREWNEIRVDASLLPALPPRPHSHGAPPLSSSTRGNFPPLRESASVRGVRRSYGVGGEDEASGGALRHNRHLLSFCISPGIGISSPMERGDFFFNHLRYQPL